MHSGQFLQFQKYFSHVTWLTMYRSFFFIKKSDSFRAYRAIRLCIIKDFLSSFRFYSQILTFTDFQCHDRTNVSLISLSMSIGTVEHSLISMIFHGDVFRRSISSLRNFLRDSCNLINRDYSIRRRELSRKTYPKYSLSVIFDRESKYSCWCVYCRRTRCLILNPGIWRSSL